jgi:hypothetical protein
LIVLLGEFICPVLSDSSGSHRAFQSLDPSIRIEVHPRSSKTSQTGFYNKSTKRSYEQRITVSNTKTIPVSNVRILDRFPVSDEEQITVKLDSPDLPGMNNALARSNSVSASSGANGKRAKAGDGISAEWHSEEGEPVDKSKGQFDWVVNIPAQGKVNLSTKWQIIAPSSVSVVGL